jgi:hypothetical protein
MSDQELGPHQAQDSKARSSGSTTEGANAARPPGLGEEGRMTGLQVDYAEVFRQLPVPVLLLTPEFDIADMNLAYLQVAGPQRVRCVPG